MEFLAQGIGGGSQDPVVERSTSRIVHLLSVYDPTGSTARQPHGYCMGERGLVRSWCGFRGVGCVLGFLPNPTVNHVQCLGGERQITRRTNGHPGVFGMAVRVPVRGVESNSQYSVSVKCTQNNASS